jgi:hypothetical protein
MILPRRKNRHRRVGIFFAVSNIRSRLASARWIRMNLYTDDPLDYFFKADSAP